MAKSINLRGRDLQKIQWTIGASGALFGTLKKGWRNKYFVKLSKNMPEGWELTRQFKEDFDQGKIWPQCIARPVFCVLLPNPFEYHNNFFHYLLGYEYIKYKEFKKNKVYRPKKFKQLLRSLMSVFLKVYATGYVFHDICWLNIKENGKKAIVFDLDGCVKADTKYEKILGSRAYHQLFLCLSQDLKYLPFLALVQMWLSMVIGYKNKDPQIFWGGQRGGALQINALIKKILWEKKMTKQALAECGWKNDAKNIALVEEALLNARSIISQESPTLFNHLLNKKI